MKTKLTSASVRHITGIHGEDPTKVYADLCEVMNDVIAHFESAGRPLPVPQVRPMREVV